MDNLIEWPWLSHKVSSFSSARPEYTERMKVIAARARANLAWLRELDR